MQWYPGLDPRTGKINYTYIIFPRKTGGGNIPEHTYDLSNFSINLKLLRNKTFIFLERRRNDVPVWEVPTNQEGPVTGKGECALGPTPGSPGGRGCSHSEGPAPHTRPRPKTAPALCPEKAASPGQPEQSTVPGSGLSSSLLHAVSTDYAPLGYAALGLVLQWVRHTEE